MKRLLTIILVVISLVAFAGCSYTYLSMPDDTNLEFWITQKVKAEDFDGYAEKYGWFGAREYYGTGYEPILGDDNQQTDPDICVKYLVTSYPDHSSKSLAVTSIYISDPSVTFWGLTLNSSIEQISSTMKKHGYKIDVRENLVTATKSNVFFRFSVGRDIRISAEVTNRYNIIF